MTAAEPPWEAEEAPGARVNPSKMPVFGPQLEPGCASHAELMGACAAHLTLLAHVLQGHAAAGGGRATDCSLEACAALARSGAALQEAACGAGCPPRPGEEAADGLAACPWTEKVTGTVAPARSLRRPWLDPRQPQPAEPASSSRSPTRPPTRTNLDPSQLASGGFPRQTSAETPDNRKTFESDAISTHSLVAKVSTSGPPSSNVNWDMTHKLAPARTSFQSGHSSSAENKGPDSDSRFRAMVLHPYTEATFLLLTLLNTVIMTAEGMYTGSEVGYKLGVYSEYGSPHSATWPGDVELAFEIWECVFAFLFTLELVLLRIALGRQFWTDRWHYVEFAVVVATDVSAILQSFYRVDYNIEVVRVLKAARVVRILRLLRSMDKVQSLNVMTTALAACVTSAVWAIVILLIVETILALLLSQYFLNRWLSDDSPLDELNKRQLYMYFGSPARALVSLFEMSVANWPVICRFLMENLHEHWMIFLILHRLGVGFVVLGIVNAVFMQETFAATETDDNIMVSRKLRAKRAHHQKMKALFARADLNGDGVIGAREFRKCVKDPAITTWLAAMDIDVKDAELVFELIDRSGEADGEITFNELVQGIQQLRGVAKSADVKILIQRFANFEKRLCADGHRLTTQARA